MCKYFYPRIIFTASFHISLNSHSPLISLRAVFAALQPASGKLYPEIIEHCAAVSPE